MGVTLLQGYLLLQGVLIGTIALTGQDGWLQVGCRVLAGWSAAGLALWGVRRHRPAAGVAYTLFALGVLANVTGTMVEKIVMVLFGELPPPTAADLFYLSTYPALIAGMALLIRRREGRDWTTVIDTGIITVGVGLLAWVFLIRPQASHTETPLPGRVVAAAYPLGDLVVLALMLRLLLGGGRRNTAFHLMMAALVLLLGADLVWAAATQLGDPSAGALRTLTVVYQIAYALIGAAALHPSVREVAEDQPREVRLSVGLLVGMGLASLIAPALLLYETLHGQVVDGRAIGVSSTALFVLVMARMAELVRRFEDRTRALAERDRSARRVLQTVNQGLLRVAGDGTMGEERSAIVDRWLGAFAPGTLFADHLGRFDSRFAEWFRIGHDAWLDGTLPPEVCLAQLPHRLRIGGRALNVNYLPMIDGPGDRGLLLVMDDVTDRLRLEQQEVEQRELLAVSHGLTRDRPRLLALLDDLGAKIAALESASDERRRQLRELHASAALAGLHLVAQLSLEAAAQVDEQPAVPPPALKGLRERWVVLTQTVEALAGHRLGESDRIELPRHELDLLDRELERGLPAARALERIQSWRREAIRRADQRES
jgi:hypothetical protein